jgi:hypothetical protein
MTFHGNEHGWQSGSDRRAAISEHDPEKWKPVFPRDKREVRLRGDHAQAKG